MRTNRQILSRVSGKNAPKVCWRASLSSLGGTVTAKRCPLDFLPNGNYVSFVLEKPRGPMKIYPERNIPILQTGEYVIFPGNILTVGVESERSLRAVDLARSEGDWIIALADGRGATSEAGSENLSGKRVSPLSRVGVLARILDVKSSQGSKKILSLSAEERFQITEFDSSGEIFRGTGAIFQDKTDLDDETKQSLLESLKSETLELLEFLPSEIGKLVRRGGLPDDVIKLSFLVAQHLNLRKVEALEVLESASQKDRLLRILELLVRKKENLRLQSRIHDTLAKGLDKRQREALLREQMKAIQEELGEGSDGKDAPSYREKIEAAGMPHDVKAVALREASRLERMGEQSPESHVIRNYLDLLCDMPWTDSGGDSIDLEAARIALDRDHHGLEKIKRRILEHLAVMKLQPERKGSILLFVGPPGVGKTSLGKSIAEALNRQFVRVSLGGVRDDADIRGHRRTYIGALPGRIIDGIRRAKSKDPVFVLDEIDKVARGWGGDPSSALLEALDPEQNQSFHDHYLDVPFDLSQVLFIGTANSRENIPAPLLDRMEVIELSGYTGDEKLHIAKNHLLPTELRSHALQDRRVEISDAVLGKIIDGYTREAGVRNLQREIRKVIRDSAHKIARNPEEAVVVGEEALHGILGPVRFESEALNSESRAGVVTGLAWTPVGGEILFVEAALIPGEGKTFVTGQLGEVMKESAQIAVSLARSRLDGVVKSVIHRDRDIHLHVPGGATPKDGPSAGVALLTSVVSMMLDIPVSNRMAMTGEITLRGKVLPVGGIKEKVLAAIRSGITEIILPVKNARDLEEIPEDIRQSVKFYFVSDIEELLRRVFGGILPERLPHPLAQLPLAVVSASTA